MWPLLFAAGSMAASYFASQSEKDAAGNMPDAPPIGAPSQAEGNMMRRQRNNLQKAMNQYNQMTPELYGLMGYLYDNGLKQMSEQDFLAKMPTELRNLYDVAKMQYGNLSEALMGRGSGSKALEADIAKQKETLIQSLTQRYGANWQNTTAGIQAMANFEKNANIATDEARRANIGMLSGQLQDTTSTFSGLRGQRMGLLQSVPFGRAQFSQMLTPAIASEQASRSLAYQGAMGQYGGQMNQWGANANANAGMWRNIGQRFGMLENMDWGTTPKDSMVKGGGYQMPSDWWRR